ncbi:MAG: zf-HC2 domain-containing protein [Acidobacteriota bacterium]
MTCLRDHKNGADLLIGYLENTLPVPQRAELDLHASTCAECRALLAVQSTLDDYEVPEVSANFDARLYAKIAQQEAKPRWWNVRVLAPMTAAAAAVLAVGLYINQPAPQVDPSPEVLQLEQALQDMELLMPLEASL